MNKFEFKRPDNVLKIFLSQIECFGNISPKTHKFNNHKSEFHVSNKPFFKLMSNFGRISNKIRITQSPFLYKNKSI